MLKILSELILVDQVILNISSNQCFIFWIPIREIWQKLILLLMYIRFSIFQ